MILRNSYSSSDSTPPPIWDLKVILSAKRSVGVASSGYILLTSGYPLPAKSL